MCLFLCCLVTQMWRVRPTEATRLDICCCQSLYFSSSCAASSSVNASEGACAGPSCREAMAALPKEACGVSMLPALEPVLATVGAAQHVSHSARPYQDIYGVLCPAWLQ